MKILEIIPQLSSGGAERFVVDLCNELSERHDVTLMVLHPLNENTNFYLPQVSSKVRVVTMNKRRGFDIALFYKIFKFIKNECPNIVHTHLRGIVYILLTVFLCKKCKYFHTVHNDAAKEASDFVNRITRRFLFKEKKVVPVTISKESQCSFKDFYGMNDIPMIPNGRNIPVDLQVSDAVKNEINQYKKSESTRVIVCLARFEPVKRQDLLARVAKNLSQEGFDFTLLYIGNKRDAELVSRTEMSMPECAYLLGERENPLEYLQFAHAYCLFSHHEGLPISLIEALGVGCVPVCTPVGGIVNLVDNGKNGILADSITEQDCYIALKRFLSLSDQELSAMSSAAKISYAPYTMSECANNYERIFNLHI